jgi:hypothetical protein
MEQQLELLFGGAGDTPTPERRLLMVRAALAGIHLSRASSHDALREAAWALEGLCVGMANVLDGLERDDADQLVKSVCLTVRVGLQQVKHEVTGQLWELPECLMRARTILLRSLVLLTEVQATVARRRGHAREPVDAVEVARAVVTLAVRTNPTDSKWIVLVGYAEIALLALVPREQIDARFARKLTALRTLLSECTNYESRLLAGVPALGAAL